MNKGLTNRRIPTLVVLFILVSSVAITLNLANNRSLYVGQANSDIKPKNINISNVTDNTFNVSFTTGTKTKSLLILNQDGTTNLILDDRDKPTGQQKEYFSHFITVTNLKPKTKYIFKVLINDSEYSFENFKITTGDAINKMPPIQ